MLTDSNRALLLRYVAGELSPSERSDAEKLVRSDPRAAELVAALRDQLRVDFSVPAAPSSASSLAELRTRMAEAKPTRAAQRSSAQLAVRSVATRNVPIARVGIAFAIVCIAAGGWWLGHSSRTSSAKASYREYVTGRAQRATIDLGDGSRVSLAPASRLRFSPEAYKSGKREVSIEGEAFFEVSRDHANGRSASTSPFIVRVAGTETRVLGTAFTVRKYDTDRGVEVAVRDGKVSAFGVVLAAGDAAQLIGNAVALAHGVDPSSIGAWVDGRLVIEDAPLSEVIAQVERWYDIDVTIANPALLSRRLGGAFRNQSSDEVLNQIALTLGAHVEHNGQRVILR